MSVLTSCAGATPRNPDTSSTVRLPGVATFSSVAKCASGLVAASRRSSAFSTLAARPHLVAKLALDLIEVERQLAIAAHVAPHQIHDPLFVGGADAEVGALAILEAQKLRPVLVPATGFLPQLGRHCGRQKDLDGAR